MSRRVLVPLLAGLAAGCAAPPTAVAPRPSEVAAVARTAPTLHRVAHQVPVPAGPLDLAGLVNLAVERHPDIAAAAARVVEARGELIQAGLYPNPTVSYVGNTINDGPGTAGQQGVQVTQEFVTGGKRGVAQAGARHGIAAADWQAASRWAEAVARVRSAYYEYQTARAVLRASDETVTQFAEGLRRAEELAKAGTVLNHEVLRLRVELTQSRDRAGAARERVTAAERALAVAAGVAALPGPVADEALPAAAPDVSFDQAAAAADESSPVREAVAVVEQARWQLRLAELQTCPNVEVLAAAQYDFAIRAPVANAGVAVPLPVFNKNQGNILAARARVAVATAAVEQARLRQRERLTAAFQKYHNARRQAAVYEAQVIPDARAVLEQAGRVFQAKGERFFETLDAARVLSQARLDYVQAVGDLWQAVAEIEALAQPPAARPAP